MIDPVSQAQSPAGLAPLVDPFGRKVEYLRVSVTDRCDLRCVYCMAEDMSFLPKAEVLTLEELDRLCSAFVKLGTRKLRLTGGEPLVRRDVMRLIRSLGRHIESGDLDELTLTTNGTMLFKHAAGLYEAGVRRINVSLDTLDPHKFQAITRWGKLDKILGGIQAAKDAGLKIKINTVALKGVNEEGIPDLIAWAHGQGFDITLIEVMPLGEVEEDRFDHYLPLSVVRERLDRMWTLAPSGHRTGGPARYFDVAETGGRLGLITPLTNNFCDGCNRIRIAATGTVYGCLGHNQKVELRDALRSGGAPEVDRLLDLLLAGKPRRHEFRIGGAPAVQRHMSVTGG